jgi:hypothetical protein
MRCPACGSTKLRIEVVFAGELAFEFRNGEAIRLLEEPALDSRWEDVSPCRCSACAWSGTVGDLRRRAAMTAQPGGLELHELERDLAEGDCPPRLRRPLGRLLESVRRMRVHLQVLETLERSLESPGRAGLDDTVVA